jgi:hypothetical protein
MNDIPIDGAPRIPSSKRLQEWTFGQMSVSEPFHKDLQKASPHLKE